MLLTMDVGNTNVKCGVFDGDTMVAYLRLSTDIGRTSDEYGLSLVNFLQYKGLTLEDITAIAMSSVVPSINFTLEHMCDTYFQIKPLVVSPGIRTGVNIKYDNPREVGSDRICSIAAAHKLYGGPVIVIDFGTATTFSTASSEGDFLGGAIMPGLKLSSEALVATAAKLPRIELIRPEHVINRTTITNMQSGIIYGYIGAVEHIIRKMREELGAPAKVVATGGMAVLVSPASDSFDILNGQLTLEGLRIIYERNMGYPE